LFPVEVENIADRGKAAREPTKLVIEMSGLSWQDVLKTAQRGAQSARGHAHVVKLLRILASTRTGFAAAQQSELFAHHPEGEVTEMRLVNLAAVSESPEATTRPSNGKH